MVSLESTSERCRLPFLTHSVLLGSTEVREVPDWFEYRIYKVLRSSTFVSITLHYAYFIVKLYKAIGQGALIQIASPRVEEKHLLDTDCADDMANGHVRQLKGGAAGNH